MTWAFLLVSSFALAEPVVSFFPLEADVTGGLDKATVDASIAAVMPALRACYADELVRSPTLTGEVLVEFQVLAGGVVALAETERSTLLNVPVESCVDRVIVRLAFPEAARLTFVRFRLRFFPAPPVPVVAPDACAGLAPPTIDAGRVTVGASHSFGAAEPAVLARAIEPALGGIRCCYARALALRPALAGTRVAILSVERDGTVRGVTADRTSTLGDAEVGSCVDDQLRALRVPQPGRGYIDRVTYPLAFAPAEGP